MTHEAIRQHAADLAALLADRDILAAGVAWRDDAIATLQAAAAELTVEINELTAELDAIHAPPAAPPPPPPAPTSGATITTDIPAGWRETIREDFAIDCVEGGFGAIYPQRGIKFYPRGYADTRWKQHRAGEPIPGGEYSADFISVSDSICKQRMFVRAQPTAVTLAGIAVPVGQKIVQCAALVPVAVAGNGKWGDAPGMIVEQRSRFTYTDGIKSAHLLWPQSDHSLPDGEIDYPEFESSSLVDCFVHHQGATSGSDQKRIATTIDPRQWHTYRLMWSMGRSVALTCDGIFVDQYMTRIPWTPMHCVLQNESWLAAAAVPANATGLVETDWIRVMVPA